LPAVGRDLEEGTLDIGLRGWGVSAAKMVPRVGGFDAGMLDVVESEGLESDGSSDGGW
jgi:hypothetical protein